MGITKEEIIMPPEHPSCVSPLDGSITDIVRNHNIPASKVLIGKIVARADGNNGWVDVNTLAGFVSKAKAAFPDLGGVMGWQWGSDTDGKWVEALNAALGSGANSTATVSTQ